jgi:DNA-binding response OmpR family regulator
MTSASRILIVEDEPNIRLVFRTALEAAGYHVNEAPDGESALARLSAEPADLVFLDLRMPGIDGVEMLRRLRDSGSDTPVVIVTAYGDVPNAVQAMKLGAIDFVSKPLSPDSLRQIAHDVLSRHAHRPAHVDFSGPVTVESQFRANLSRAKMLLNRRAFDEAEIHLKQAIALNDHSAEAHNLMGVLHELRNEHDASYRSYKAALKADRHYEPAKHNMTRYYERFTFGSSNVPVDTGEG